MSVETEPTQMAKFETASFTLEDLGLVDVDPHRDFDDLTALASETIGAPVSLVTIVEHERDRQYFLSHKGLEGQLAEHRSTPLSYSVCKYVMAADDVLRVEDARTHPLVCDNGAVTDLGVVAYLGAPVHDQSGRPIGALCVTDRMPRFWSDADAETLTRLANSVDNLVRLRAELLISERLRSEVSEFAYGLTHDLRAPTNTIQMLIQVIERELSDGTVETLGQALTMVDQTTVRMRRLIDDVLQYVTTLADTMETELVDLGELAAEVVADLSAEIARTGAEVRVDELASVKGSRFQLRLLLQNLVANAMKYRREDVPPEVEIRIEPDADPSTVQLSVSDNGIGIPASEFETIFEMFARLKAGSGSPESGSGIGLATCRRVVANHGGRIEVESEEGVGSTFTVTLPVDPGEGSDPPPTAAAQGFSR